MSSIVEFLKHAPLPPDEPVQPTSLRWWLEYLLKAYEQDPYHVLVELSLLVVVIYLLLRPSYDPKREAKLTRREEDELIAEWKPQTLVPPLSELDRQRPVPVVENATGPYVLADKGRQYLNLCSNNFCGLANRPEIKEACRATINKYGVGSCGPRGFYGTTDIHLELERALAEFYGAPEAILYSDGIASTASAIPAFSKRGDLIICDEACSWAVQQGVMLSRSNVLRFKHNDMDDLERVLQDVREKDALRQNRALHRRFIVVEGVYQSYGDICPLLRVVELAKDYKYRVIMDDSFGVGVLGATGRGSHEHWGVPLQDLTMICFQLDASLGSVGGACVSPLRQVVDHQRLSGAGYCFSASAPPYIATAGRVALELLRKEPNRPELVRTRALRLRRGLQERVAGITVLGGVDQPVPVVFLCLRRSLGTRAVDETLLRLVEGCLREDGVLAYVPLYTPSDMCSRLPPSLRISVTAEHSENDIDLAVEKVAAAFEFAFQRSRELFESLPPS